MSKKKKAKKRTKKNTKMLKRLITEDLLKKMSRNLGLGEWTIDAHFSDSMPDGVAGTCAPSPEYLYAYIELNAKAIGTKRYALKILHHELLHCVVSPMRMHQNMLLGILEGKAHDMAHESFRAREEELIGDIYIAMCRSGARTGGDYLKEKKPIND